MFSDGFETLIKRTEIRELTHDWIDRYEARRVPPTQRPRSFSEVAKRPRCQGPLRTTFNAKRSSL